MNMFTIFAKILIWLGVTIILISILSLLHEFSANYEIAISGSMVSVIVWIVISAMTDKRNGK